MQDFQTFYNIREIAGPNWSFFNLIRIFLIQKGIEPILFSDFPAHYLDNEPAFDSLITYPLQERFPKEVLQLFSHSGSPGAVKVF